MKIKRENKKSGSGADNDTVKWPFYKKMTFFNEVNTFSDQK
jgi:hypothetical protein